MGDGFGSLFVFVRNFSRFLRAISVRVRIIAIRIVIVGGAGVHSIENDAEDPALDATQQIAGAGKGFLGSFAAANDEKNAVGLHGKNHGACGRKASPRDWEGAVRWEWRRDWESRDAERKPDRDLRHLPDKNLNRHIFRLPNSGGVRRRAYEGRRRRERCYRRAARG